jgi:hypothetical protein
MLSISHGSLVQTLRSTNQRSRGADRSRVLRENTVVSQNLGRAFVKMPVQSGTTDLVP